MSRSPLPATASPATYRKRRARWASAIERPMVVFAGHAQARNYPANTHPFRAGSTYLYLGGPPLENAAWLIEPASNGNDGCTLLRVAWQPDDTLWMGEQSPDADLADAAGISEANIVDADRLAGLISDRLAGSIVPPCPETIATARALNLEPANEGELAAMIDMRLIKDEQELAAMRRAAAAGIAAHRAAIAATSVGRTEDDTEAALTASLVSAGCRHSFSPIVTIRGQVLHGSSAGRRLEDGALILVDAGAEEPGGYASDITRTFPVSGRWTEIQRRLYDTVLRALRAAVSACRPGARYRDVHHLAARVICEGLVELRLLRGNPAELVERGAHGLFFPHGVGHLLGLDVHDMEDFGDRAGYPPQRRRPQRFGDRFLRLDRDLQPGMTVTVEPGIYFVPDIWRRGDLVSPLADVINRSAVDAQLDDQLGGIRIEDNVVVRGGQTPGPEVLSAALPSDADEVAALVGNRV